MEGQIKVEWYRREEGREKGVPEGVEDKRKRGGRDNFSRENHHYYH